MQTTILHFQDFPQKTIKFLYMSVVFIGAYLLFQIQPICAKIILPHYGGVAGVWSASLLFFQGFLFLGYYYAHAIVLRLRIRRQVFLHLVLLGIAALYLPSAEALMKPPMFKNPAASILTSFVCAIGIPCLLLSSTAPLLQYWFFVKLKISAYRLYSVSNMGAMVGMLSYPVIIEPFMGLKKQVFLWSLAFIAYLLLFGLCALSLCGEKQVNICRGNGIKVFFGRRCVSWFLLSACGVIILLSGTSWISRDIAPIPLFWLMPLSLYLLSFIVSFAEKNYYERRIWIPLFLVSMIVLSIFTGNYDKGVPDKVHEILIYSAAMFFSFMVCHGELEKMKPLAHRLTSFYLAIALGGGTGGVFVNFVAPRIFTDGYWEFYLAFFVVYIISAVVFSDKNNKKNMAWPKILWILSLPFFLFFTGKQVAKNRHNLIASSRNFYGVLRVREENEKSPNRVYSFYNGSIMHGMQFKIKSKEMLPTAYFGPESGLGIVFRYLCEKGSVKSGIVGFGAGTAAVYAGKNDKIIFYEINPEAVKVGNKYFNFYGKCPADKKIIVGDGRISLESQLKNGGPEKFDLLAIDAFNGDAIPVHLLTKEAFELYFSHIKTNGFLLFNISNKYVNLVPLIKTFSKIHHVDTFFAEEYFNADLGTEYSLWAIMTRNKEFIKLIYSRHKEWWWWPDCEFRKIFWSDDKNNLLNVLEI